MIPIFRAVNKLRKRKWPQGNLLFYPDKKQVFIEKHELHHNVYEVRPEDVRMSFDDGRTWFSLEHAERAFDEYMKTHGYEGETK